MTQPNIFEISAPAGPSNNSAFVSATTAPPTFVFRPGATFSDGGPVRQNVYNTAGLPLLQGIIAGNGLSPAVPLPSSVVECDFNSSTPVVGQYGLAASLALGLNCTLRGITTAGNGSTSIASFTFPISGIKTLDNISISSGSIASAFTPSGSTLTLRNGAGIAGSAGSDYFLSVPNGFTFFVYETSEISGNAILSPNGHGCAIELFDSSHVAINAVQTSGSGSAVFNIHSPGVTLDHSYFDKTGITVQFLYPPSNVLIYAPGGTDSATTFTDFGQLVGYISAASAYWDDFTIQVLDNNVTIPAGDYVIEVTNLTFEGLWAEQYPDLVFAAGVVIEGVIGLTFKNFQSVTFNNTSTAAFEVNGDVFSLLIDNAGLSNNGSTAMVNLIGSELIMTVINQPAAVVTAFSGLLIAADLDSEVEFFFFDNASFDSSNISIASGATVLILNSSPGVTLDTAFYNTSGVSVTFAFIPPPIVVYENNGSYGTSFSDFGQLVGYINSIVQSAVTEIAPEWTILVKPTGASIAITAASYNIDVSSLIFKGVVTTTTALTGPTLVFDDGVIFDPPLASIQFIDCDSEFHSTATPVMTHNTSSVFARFQSNAEVNQEGTVQAIDVTGGAHLRVTLANNGSSFTTSTTPVWRADNASNIEVLLTSFSQLQVNTCKVDTGGAGRLELFSDETSNIDPTFFSLSNVILNMHGVTALPFADRLTEGAGGGALWCATDGFTSVWQPTFGSWLALVNGTLCFEPPLAAEFVQLNGTSATLVDAAGTLIMTSTTGNEIFQIQDNPLSAEFTVTAAFSSLWAPAAGGGHESIFAVALSTGTNTGPFKRIGFYATTTGDVHFEYQWFTDINTGSTTKFDIIVNNLLPTGSTMFFKVTQDLTNFTVFYSANGRDYRQIYQEAANAFNVPGFAGLYTQDTSGNINTSTIYSFSIG